MSAEGTPKRTEGAMNIQQSGMCGRLDEKNGKRKTITAWEKAKRTFGTRK